MFETNETREEVLARRSKAKKEYGKLYETISEILFRYDPIYINFETNTDEYEPEVGTILPRLRNCHSAADVLTVVHEEFQKWFGEDSGEREVYQEIAEEVWNLWRN